MQHIRISTVRSRSELLRELVKRYEKLENERAALGACINGYLQRPEPAGEQPQSILRDAMRGQASEDWS